MRALSSLLTGTRHSLGVVVEATLIAAIIAALLLALSPFYAPASTLVGSQGVDAAKPVSGHLTIPDGIFTGTTTADANPGGDNAWVMAECFQSGTVVYRQYVKVDANNQAVLRLGPTPSWTSGGATCRADEGTFVKGGRWKVLASTTFQVAG
jgi:hypothetical protein